MERWQKQQMDESLVKQQHTQVLSTFVSIMSHVNYAAFQSSKVLTSNKTVQYDDREIILTTNSPTSCLWLLSKA